MFCHFAAFAGPAIDAASLTGLAAVPGLARALVHTPAAAHDPYLHDGAPPALVVQSYFDTIAALEAACAEGGGLHMLSALAEGRTATQQAMLVRRFPVPDPAIRAQPHCTYLVSYEGRADDLPRWLAHYIGHHPPIMARFPGIRQIEIYTRIDWCGALPFARVEHMQRNKVVFDSPAALTAALESPVRHEMRADYHTFPPFSGPVTHFPMRTAEITARGA